MKRGRYRRCVDTVINATLEYGLCGYLAPDGSIASDGDWLEYDHADEAGLPDNEIFLEPEGEYKNAK